MNRPAPRGVHPAYVVAVGPGDVGARVSLRRRVDGPQPLSDVVGELLSWDDGVLVVRTRRRGDVAVPEADLVSGLVVPAASR